MSRVRVSGIAAGLAPAPAKPIMTFSAVCRASMRAVMRNYLSSLPGLMLAEREQPREQPPQGHSLVTMEAEKGTAWSLEFGAWSLELGVWSLELGAWSLEFGWSLPCYGGGAVGGVHGPDRARQRSTGSKGQLIRITCAIKMSIRCMMAIVVPRDFCLKDGCLVPLAYSRRLAR